MSGVRVTGGAAGLAADYRELVQLAHLLDRTRRAVDQLVDALCRADLSAGADRWSASPVPAALAAEIASVGDSLAEIAAPWGECGIASIALQDCAGGLFAAAAAYQHVDGLVGATISDTIDFLVSSELPAGPLREVGHLLGGLVEPFAVAGHAAWVDVTQGPLDAAQTLLTDDPRVVDVLVDGTGAGMAMTLLGELPERPPEVTDLGPDDRPLAAQAPSSIADLMRGLALRNSGHHGEVSVSFVVGADEKRRAIVDIPGTKSWNPLPNADATSVSTDLRAMDGERTSYELGVLQAMRRAGVSPDDEVMLVGHSEGGIVAVDAACHANLHRFDITHIVTAGSPIGVVARSLPQSVQVLALENASDIVPHTDGAANPVTAGITTATVDQSATGIGPSHDLEASYVPAAEQVDASDDPSIRLFAASAAGFLSGGWVLAAPGTTTTVAERPTMRTTAYWVERK